MTEHRIVETSARKHPDGLNPQRVLLSLRALFRPDGGPMGDPTDAGADRPAGTGIEPPVPVERAGEPVAVTRTFAFVDITGFTSFCDQHGEHAAIAVLTRFRNLVRDVSARRGVRVAKWLGDGAMLVGVEQGPVIASVAEIVVRTEGVGLDTHAGVATGTVLLFEGDDYVGRPPNLAARLCDAAEPGEILAGPVDDDQFPAWVETKGSVTVEVAGVGEVVGVRSIGACPAVTADLTEDDAA
jgi:class 3 adenylate cyclase